MLLRAIVAERDAFDLGWLPEVYERSDGGELDAAIHAGGHLGAERLRSWMLLRRLEPTPALGAEDIARWSGTGLLEDLFAELGERAPTDLTHRVASLVADRMVRDPIVATHVHELIALRQDAWGERRSIEPVSRELERYAVDLAIEHSLHPSHCAVFIGIPPAYADAPGASEWDRWRLVVVYARAFEDGPSRVIEHIRGELGGRWTPL